MSQWYAIRAASGRERFAHDGLVEQGFAVFVPHERVARKINRSIEPIERPLFPGYLFVFCSPDDFCQIRETAGVHQFVRYMVRGETAPVVIPFAAILEMQVDERAGRYDRTAAKPNAYRPKKGHKVQVVAGPWMKFVGRVLDTPRGRRAKVMIEGPFGRGVALDVAHLKAA